MRTLPLLGALLVIFGAASAQQAEEDAERQRLRATRAEVEARYQGRVRDCEQRFFVTDCLERARKERSAALTPIDARIATLDEAERTRRARERLESIEAGKAERAVTSSAAASEPASPRTPKPAPAPSGKLPRATAPQAAASSAAEEQAARERYQRKQDEAAAHRAEVERRNAGSKAPAAPLPPAAASRP